MKYRRGIVASGLAILVACSGSGGTEPRLELPELATLEPIAYDGVGPGKLVFFRAWAVGEGTSRPDALYVIDGVARRSWGAVLDRSSYLTALVASPDGRSLAIADVGVRGDNALATAPLTEATVNQRVPLATHGTSQVAWTTGSDSLLFIVGNQFGPSVLYARRAGAGGSLAQLFPRTETPTGRGECELALINIRGPISVAASGSLAMTCLDSAIHVLDRGAATSRSVYSPAGGQQVSRVWSPTWAPDGRRIAFLEATLATAVRGQTVSVRIVNADGTAPVTIATLLSNGLPLFGEACWMPNGERIAFTITQQNTANIYVVRTSGGQPIRITNAAARDLHLSCSL